MGSYVGIDLHRRGSVIVVMDEHGETLSTTRIDNDPLAWAAAAAAAGPEAEVAVEATWGWYWAAEVIAEAGSQFGTTGFDGELVSGGLHAHDGVVDVLGATEGSLVSPDAGGTDTFLARLSQSDLSLG